MSNESSGSSLGRGFLSGGYVLLGVGGGVALGYWASDWGTRFFPTVSGGILFLWMCGFALFAIGAHMERTVTDVFGRRWSRRAALFATCAAAMLVSLVAVLVMGRPTPLTAMTESEFRRTHELDARYFRDLDRSLRGIVAELESRGDLFDADVDGARALTVEDEALVLDAWVGYLDTAIALDRIRRFHEDFYRFDLSRMERLRHVRSFLLSFAAELSLFENTTRIIELLDGNENVVRFLNLDRSTGFTTRARTPSPKTSIGCGVRSSDTCPRPRFGDGTKW